MKTWMQDLRFFIGSFFFLVGAVLVFQGLLSPALVEGINLNLYTGLGFVIFSLGTLWSLANIRL